MLQEKGGSAVTVVVAGSFFVSGGFSPMDAPMHFRLIATKRADKNH